MTIRQSTALRNFVQSFGSFAGAFNGGKLKFYSGSQPASADTAPSGTLLVTITDASGAHTAEVQSTGTMTLTGGASGSVDTITINALDILGGSVPFNTSLTQTAADCVTAINRNPKNKLFTASSSGAVMTFKAKPGLGTLPNTWVVAQTLTTITSSDTDMTGGVNAVNGLLFNASVAGAMTKKIAQTWSGVVASAGTAGWFRLEAPMADSLATDAAELYLRLDGSIATSGADLNISNTTLAAGATETVTTFTPTEPASA